ncbi:hypothetical protein OC844_003230 [Tilletia horrida]|nr:hypothetical protein OC844_003230 [Tilletia horrida]
MEDGSPLSIVRERMRPGRAPAARVDASSSSSSAPKKSRFQLAREAERRKADAEAHEAAGPQSTPDPMDVVLAAEEEDSDAVWLDGNGAPLSAFKKAMLQRKGLGPPGGMRSTRSASTSTPASHPAARVIPAVAPAQASAVDQSSQDDLESISQENQAKVAAMSPEQVQQEVKELQEQIGSDLLEQFRKLALSRARPATGAPPAQGQHETEAGSPAPADKPQSAKKTVAFDLPPSAAASSSRDLSTIASNVEEATSALRFHEHSDTSNLDAFRITHSGDVEATGRPVDSVETYSIPMLLSLAQSSAAAQRQLGFTILTRAFSQHSHHLELKIGSEVYISKILRTAAFAARYTFSDKHRSMATAARRCLLAILSFLHSGQHLQQPPHFVAAADKHSDDGHGSSSRELTAAILNNGGNQYPESLQRDLVQSLPQSSAASLLISDLMQSGLVTAIRADLLFNDRILSAKINVRHKSSAASRPIAHGSAEDQDALEGLTESASLLQILAQTSDLHAESIAEEKHDTALEPNSSASAMSSGDTLLQMLVKHGIRTRRWPPIQDGQNHLDVIPEVLGLVAAIANSTPRAALKLTQQTNIANTLLRFIALPPWALAEDSEVAPGQEKSNIESRATEVPEEDDDDVKGKKERDAAWMLRNWNLFASALLAFGGLSRHSLEGALLDAWPLWLDVSEWVSQADFPSFRPDRTPIASVINASGVVVRMQCVQLRCASRVLQLFSSWIDRAVSSEGDFEDLTWPDVAPTREVALAVLHRFSSSQSSSASSIQPGLASTQAAAPTDSDALSLQTERLHLLASATHLLTTWLQAAHESARNPAQTASAQLRSGADAKLCAFWKGAVEEAAGALGLSVEGVGEDVGTKRGSAWGVLLRTAAQEVLTSVRELCGSLASSSAEDAGSGAEKDANLQAEAEWQALARRVGQLLLSLSEGGRGDGARDAFDETLLR